MLTVLMSSKKLTLLFLLALLIACPFFFIGGPNYQSSSLFRAFWDWGHILFFSGLVVVVQPMVKVKGWRFGVLISLIVFVVGGIIEIVQSYTGRDGNWQDLLRDLSGTWFGLFWLQKATVLVWMGRALTFALLWPSVWAVFLAAFAQVQAEKYFPVISSFEHYTDARRWKGKVELSSEYHSEGDHSLRAYFNTQRYSPIALDEFLGDWTGYSIVAVDIYNPQPEVVELIFRVNDLEHDNGKGLYTDRFNRKLFIEHGWNHIAIPIAEIEHAPENRLMNLHEIKRVLFFTSSLPQPKILYIDNFLLK